MLGFELAVWLSRELAAQGVVTSYPEQEDWGWYLEHGGDDAEYMICCSGGEYDGNFEWSVFVTRARGVFRRSTQDETCDEMLKRVKDVLVAVDVSAKIEHDK